MSDLVPASVSQVVTAINQSNSTFVGRVTQFCSRLRVAIVELIEGGSVGVGYELQFGTPEQPCTRRRPVIKVNVTSIQLDHVSIPRANGPGSFGIKTGNRGMATGTPVYVVKTINPAQG